MSLMESRFANTRLGRGGRLADGGAAELSKSGRCNGVFFFFCLLHSLLFDILIR